MKALRQKGFYLWGKVINKALASTFHKNQSAAEIQHVGQVSYRDVWLEDNEKAIHIQLEY